MSDANPARGDVVVNLGSQGEIVCRPGLRALMAIDSYRPDLTISDLVLRLSMHASLVDVVRIIHETHVDAEPNNRHRLSLDDVGRGVLEVGMDKVFDACSELLKAAWSEEAFSRQSEAESDEGDDPGNPRRAGTSEGSPPVNGLESPSSDSGSP